MSIYETHGNILYEEYTYHVYNLTLTCSYNGVKCSWHILDMPLNYHTKTQTCPLNLTIIYPYHVPKMSLYWYLFIQLGTSWYCLIPFYTYRYLLVPLGTSWYLWISISFYFHIFCWLIDWHQAITIGEEFAFAFAFASPLSMKKKNVFSINSVSHWCKW